SPASINTIASWQIIGDIRGLELASSLTRVSTLALIRWPVTSWCNLQNHFHHGNLWHALETTFIRRRSVDRRHRNIKQAQVHSERRTMMNQVIHHESAHNTRAWQREDLIASHQQGPLALPTVIISRHYRTTRT